MPKTKLPESFREYFWDVDFNKLSVEEHGFLVIKRILDRGYTGDIRWLLDTYGKDKIREVLLVSRDISKPTGNFWADVLGLDKSTLPCLQKPYSPIHFGLYS